MKKILLVEDNDDIAALLAMQLKMADYAVESLQNGLDLVARLLRREASPDAIILDLMLPGRSGPDLLNTIKSALPDTKIFIFSAYEEYRDRLPPGTTEGFFCKTDGVDRLIQSLDKALKRTGGG